jgi:V/A-type H+-transporting ATPase subunit D
MEIKVNATRMELLKLKRRSALAKRGHKLLKDKLDGLIQHFIATSKELRGLYDGLRLDLVQAFTESAIATAETDQQELRAALLYPTMESIVKGGVVNLMGVKVPNLELELKGELISFGGVFYTQNFISALEKFKEFLPKMVRLAALVKALQRMGQEIVEIKRRVNALEYILIPELDEKVRYIKMKLSEIERGNIVTLLKIKEIVQASENR